MHSFTEIQNGYFRVQAKHGHRIVKVLRDWPASTDAIIYQLNSDVASSLLNSITKLKQSNVLLYRNIL